VCWVVRFLPSWLQQESEELNSDRRYYVRVYRQYVGSIVTWNVNIRWTPCSILLELPTNGTSLFVPTSIYVTVYCSGQGRDGNVWTENVQTRAAENFGIPVSKFSCANASWAGDGLAIYTTAHSFNIPTVHCFPASLINARVVQ